MSRCHLSGPFWWTSYLISFLIDTNLILYLIYVYTLWWFHAVKIVLYCHLNRADIDLMVVIYWITSTSSAWGPFCPFLILNKNGCPIENRVNAVTLNRTKVDKVIFATAYNKTKPLSLLIFDSTTNFIGHFCLFAHNKVRLHQCHATLCFLSILVYQIALSGLMGWISGFFGVSCYFFQWNHFITLNLNGIWFSSGYPPTSYSFPLFIDE